MMGRVCNSSILVNFKDDTLQIGLSTVKVQDYTKYCISKLLYEGKIIFRKTPKF